MVKSANLGDVSDAAASLANIGGLPIARLDDFFIPAGAFIPSAVNGAEAVSFAPFSTNGYTSDAFKFDAVTEESIQCSFVLPGSYDNLTFKFRPHWTAESGSGGVVWETAAFALDNDEQMSSVAFGTGQTSTDTYIASNDEHIGPTSSAITVGNTPGTRQRICLLVSRKPGNGSDTLAVDAVFLGLTIQFSHSALVTAL